MLLRTVKMMRNRRGMLPVHLKPVALHATTPSEAISRRTHHRECGIVASEGMTPS
jgi:hypothetical protein